MTIKDEIIQLMQGLPEEATAEETIDEAMDRLYLLYRIRGGPANRRREGNFSRGS